MSHTMVGQTVPGIVNFELVYEYGSGSFAPGWYARDIRREGFVGAGPWADSVTALHELIWFLAKRHPQFNSAQQNNRQMYDPIIAIEPHNIRVAPTARIDSMVKLEGKGRMILEDYVHVASFCHLGIGGGLTILEEGSSCGSGARLVSGSNVPGFGHGCSAVAPDAVFERSFVHLKRNSTVFAGAIVLPGVTLGENSCLAAGGVATKDIPDNEIWGGVPACKIGEVK